MIKLKTPIFLEYYPHEQTKCYKIEIPWTVYGKEIAVLCRENEGIEMAKKLARKVLNERLTEVLAASLEE